MKDSLMFGPVFTFSGVFFHEPQFPSHSFQSEVLPLVHLVQFCWRQIFLNSFLVCLK